MVRCSSSAMYASRPYSTALSMPSALCVASWAATSRSSASKAGRSGRRRNTAAPITRRRPRSGARIARCPAGTVNSPPSPSSSGSAARAAGESAKTGRTPRSTSASAPPGRTSHSSAPTASQPRESGCSGWSAPARTPPSVSRSSRDAGRCGAAAAQRAGGPLVADRQRVAQIDEDRVGERRHGRPAQPHHDLVEVDAAGDPPGRRAHEAQPVAVPPHRRGPARRPRPVPYAAPGRRRPADRSCGARLGRDRRSGAGRGRCGVGLGGRGLGVLGAGTCGVGLSRGARAGSVRLGARRGAYPARGRRRPGACACAGNDPAPRRAAATASGCAGAPRGGPRGRRPAVGARRRWGAPSRVSNPSVRGSHAARAVRPAEIPIPGIRVPGTEFPRGQRLFLCHRRTVCGPYRVVPSYPSLTSCRPSVTSVRPSAYSGSCYCAPLRRTILRLNAPGAHQGSHEDTCAGVRSQSSGKDGTAQDGSGRQCCQPSENGGPQARITSTAARPASRTRSATCGVHQPVPLGLRELVLVAPVPTAVRVHGDVQEVILGVDAARPTAPRLLQVHVPVLEPPARLPEQPHRPGLAGPRQLQHARAEPAVALRPCAAWCSGWRAARRARASRRRAPASRTRCRAPSTRRAARRRPGRR